MTVEAGKKTVLVTGCSPEGIGREICKAFHARGLHVIATARRPSVLAELENTPGYTCLELDVTKQESILACRDEVVKLTGGKLDILVNNAGRTQTIPATDLDLDDVRLTFETNVFSVMAMVKAFIHPLIATKGLIINISSGSAIVPYPFQAAYTASKGAVNSYSRTLRQELRPFGVRVMVAVTGTVRTNINLHVVRELPPDSIWRTFHPLGEDIFRWRQGYSRTAPSTVTADAYAARLVRDALKPEWGVWLRGLLGWGRQDWHYYGGLARIVWLASCLGEWAGDVLIYRMFKFRTLEVVLRRQEAEKAKGLKAQ